MHLGLELIPSVFLAASPGTHDSYLLPPDWVVGADALRPSLFPVCSVLHLLSSNPFTLNLTRKEKKQKPENGHCMVEEGLVQGEQGLEGFV